MRIKPTGDPKVRYQYIFKYTSNYETIGGSSVMYLSYVDEEKAIEFFKQNFSSYENVEVLSIFDTFYQAWVLPPEEIADVNPWTPTSDPTDIKVMGKTIEELGECISALARCLIQGIDESEPKTGKENRIWLQEEIADVKTTIKLLINRMILDKDKIEQRSAIKESKLTKWFEFNTTKPEPVQEFYNTKFCSVCKGSGHAFQYRSYGDPQYHREYWETCDNCKGTGVIK